MQLAVDQITAKWQVFAVACTGVERTYIATSVTVR